MTPLDRLISETASLDAAGVDAFLAAGEAHALLFTGDPNLRPEAFDVAVVLRDLLRGAGGRLRAAVIAREHEAALAARFGVAVYPTLLLLRAGRDPVRIGKIEPWTTYRDAIAALLAPEVKP